MRKELQKRRGMGSDSAALRRDNRTCRAAESRKIVGQLQVSHTLPWWMAGEGPCQRLSGRGGMTHGHVVHMDHQVGPGRNELAIPSGQLSGQCLEINDQGYRCRQWCHASMFVSLKSRSCERRADGALRSHFEPGGRI